MPLPVISNFANGTASDKENSPLPTPIPDATNATTTVSTSKGKSQKKKVPSKAVWKSADDAVLIKALVKEREARHQSDSGFKPLSWVACAAALKGIETKSGGVAKSKSSCQEHYKKVSTA